MFKFQQIDPSAMNLASTMNYLLQRQLNNCVPFAIYLYSTCTWIIPSRVFLVSKAASSTSFSGLGLKGKFSRVFETRMLDGNIYN